MESATMPRSKSHDGNANAQLALFDVAPDAKSAPSSGTRSRTQLRAIDTPELRALAGALPSFVRLGTSSWTFPGWGGIVYEGKPSQAALVREGLAAYARYPLFRTVGIDRSYYAPLSREELDAYADGLPDGFVAVSKVWDELTVFHYPDHPRFGARSGQKNGRFLDPDEVRERILPAYEGRFAPHAGPFVFEIAPMPRAKLPSEEEFCAAIERLLAALPSRHRYAFELRNRALLTPRYLSVLRAFGAAHVLNFWSAMPTIGEQLSLPGVLTTDVVVARLMLAPGDTYEAAKARFAPFDRVAAPQLGMREDIVALTLACEAAGVASLYILVNNKAEGSSPLTVHALAEAIARRRAGGVTSPRPF
jgi:uncharacterized protein YecE (DUF72 family)